MILFSSLQNAVLPFFKKTNIETTKKKNLYKYHIYNLGKKKKKKKSSRKDLPSRSTVRSDSREDKALHSVGAIRHVTMITASRFGETTSACERDGGERKTQAARDVNSFWAEGRQQEGRGQMIWP